MKGTGGGLPVKYRIVFDGSVFFIQEPGSWWGWVDKREHYGRRVPVTKNKEEVEEWASKHLGGLNRVREEIVP